MNSENLAIKPCPFCGDTPCPNDFDPDSAIGTEFSFECGCGMASSRIQISDLMTIEERLGDDFEDYMYKLEYRKRAVDFCLKKWNERV